MVKRIVGGNDIYIKWNILKNSGTTFSNPSVVLYDSFKKKCPFTVEIQDSGTTLVVNGKYAGKDQKSFGMYHLVFYNNYNEDNMNSLVYRNAFVLVHALKNSISSYGDNDADEAITVELDSDLCVALVDQSITDRDDIIESLSQLSLKNDEQDSKLNDISTHLDSSIQDLNEKIESLSIDSMEQLIQDIEDDEEVICRYLSVIDNSVNEQNYMILNTSNNIDNVSTRFNSFKNGEFNTLKNRVKDVSSYSINVSTRLQEVSTRLETLSEDIEEIISQGDTDIINRITENTTNISNISTRLIPINSSISNISTRLGNVSTRLSDLSTYTHNLVIPESYDDTVLKNRIKDVSQYAINTSSRLNDLSGVVDSLVQSGYDDTALKNRIADVSQYAINTSSRLNDLSTYTHNITIPESYDDTELTNKVNDLSTYTHNLVIPESYDDTTIKNRIKDVSQYAINVSVNLADVSSRLSNVSSYDDTLLNNKVNDVSTRLKDTSIYFINELNNTEYSILQYMAILDTSIQIILNRLNS